MSFSPLYLAVDRDDLVEVNRILKARKPGFKIEEGYRGSKDEAVAPLCHAINKGNPAIIQALLDAGASLTKHSLFYSDAEKYKLISPLDMVLDKYLDFPAFAEMVDGIPSLKEALAAPSARVRYDNVCFTKLNMAVSDRDHKKVKKLLELGVDPNQGVVEPDGVSHGSPLFVAIQLGDVESVRLLLQFGANPNLGFKQLSGRHDHPLFHVFKKDAQFRTSDDAEIARLLIAHPDLSVPGGDLRQFLRENVADPSRLQALLRTIPRDYAPPVERRALPARDFVCPTIPATPAATVLKTLAATAAAFATQVPQADYAHHNRYIAGGSDSGVSVGTMIALMAATVVTTLALVAFGYYLGSTAAPAQVVQEEDDAPVAPFRYQQQQGQRERQNTGPYLRR